MPFEKCLILCFEEFKTDINQLPDTCPIRLEIEKYIIDQIEFPAKLKKEELPPIEFNEYIKKEIKSAEKAMHEMFLQELINKKTGKDMYRKNRTKIYIWNKERIKRLNIL
jgi:hypothetical protein